MIEEEKAGDSEKKADELIQEIENPKSYFNVEKKQNKQIMWAIFMMISVILIIVVVPFVKHNFFDNFDYKGLDFQKTKMGDIIFYVTRFPVVSMTGQVTGDYSVILRNDPRKLDKIPVNVSDNKIKFSVSEGKYDRVYIAINPFIESCNNSLIAAATLSGFLGDSGLKVKSAVTDKAYAKENNQTYRWCDSSGFDTVLVFNDNDKYSSGNETSIKELESNCYELKFNNCEIMEVTERFMLIILEEYASRFEK